MKAQQNSPTIGRSRVVMTQKVERAYVERISDESRLGVGEDSIEWMPRYMFGMATHR
jgi:hypothetical protein